MNVTEAKRRMLGEARKAARLYANLVGTITRIACDDGMTLDIQWKASNFAHLCGLEYYADDNRTRRLPARRLYFIEHLLPAIQLRTVIDDQVAGKYHYIRFQ